MLEAASRLFFCNREEIIFVEIRQGIAGSSVDSSAPLPVFLIDSLS